MNLFKWILINGCVCVITYFGLVHNIVGFQNVIKFLIIFNLVITTIAVFAKQSKDKRIMDSIDKARKKRAINDTTNIIYGLAFAGFLSFYGWFGYATTDMITTILQNVLFSDEQK